VSPFVPESPEFVEEYPESQEWPENAPLNIRHLQKDTWICNQQVIGSNPIAGSINNPFVDR
jgi:hypothetical protein